MKHWIIDANMGHDGSMRALKSVYAKEDIISKEDFDAALRAHYAAAAAMKSPQREVADALMRNMT